MHIKLAGKQRCNLFTGGDRRDKSLQSYIQGSGAGMFLIEKDGDHFHIWAVTQVEEKIVPEPEPEPEPEPVKKKTKVK